MASAPSCYVQSLSELLGPRRYRHPGPRRCGSNLMNIHSCWCRGAIPIQGPAMPYGRPQTRPRLLSASNSGTHIDHPASTQLTSADIFSSWATLSALRISGFSRVRDGTRHCQIFLVRHEGPRERGEFAHTDMFRKCLNPDTSFADTTMKRCTQFTMHSGVHYGGYRCVALEEEPLRVPGSLPATPSRSCRRSMSSGGMTTERNCGV